MCDWLHRFICDTFTSYLHEDLIKATTLDWKCGFIHDYIVCKLSNFIIQRDQLFYFDIKHSDSP